MIELIALSTAVMFTTPAHVGGPIYVAEHTCSAFQELQEYEYLDDNCNIDNDICILKYKVTRRHLIGVCDDGVVRSKEINEESFEDASERAVKETNAHFCKKAKTKLERDVFCGEIK